MPQVTDVTGVFACMQIGRVQVSCNFAVFSDHWYAQCGIVPLAATPLNGENSGHLKVASRTKQLEREIKEVPHGDLKLLLFREIIRRSHKFIEASIVPTH